MQQAITIKLRLVEDVDMADFQRQFNNVLHYAYNRALEGVGKYDVFAMLQGLRNVDDLDATWRREAAKLGFAAAKLSKEKGTVAIFGGRRHFYDRLRGRITKEQYKAGKKLIPITCEGSKADRLGNRKFSFDFTALEGSVRLGKRKVHFRCHRTNRRHMAMLADLEALLHEGACGVTYKLSSTHLYIVFDLALLPKECPFEHDPDTTLAIDMNPNYVGLSIVSGGTVVLTRAYDLSKVKGNNKRRYELTQVVLAIKGLCRHWRVSYVGIEKLVMAPKDKGRGRRFNRQVNNEWCRGHFVASLKKHMCLVGCKVIELVAAYSSFIGCLTYPSETDSVAASIELNRRLRAFVDQYVVGRAPKGSVVYPVFEDGCLNRWKEEGIPSEALTGWKAAYRWLTESQHSWRLTYGAYAKRERLTALRLQSRKSLVTWISGGKDFPCLG